MARGLGLPARGMGMVWRLTAALALVAALLAGALGRAPAVAAATFTVSNLSDGGAGSLRQAIADANASEGADTIAFQAGLAGTIALTGGELVIVGDLTLAGPGAAVLTVSGNQASRIFRVAGGTVAIGGLTIAEGRAAGTNGGGIQLDAGALTLTGVALRGNTAGASGGGLATNGGTTALIDRSAVSGNTAGAFGGGLASGGALLVKNSTISGNAALVGGALSNLNAGVTATLDFATVVGNSPQGLFTGVGAITALGRSVVAGNAAIDCAGPHTSLGHNVVGQSGGCPATGPGDAAHAGTLATLVGPLAANGGPTPTHALPIGSPAVDRVPTDLCVGVAGDQRGVARPQGARCDSGAFELAPDCAALFADVANADAACLAIAALSARGVINGYATTSPTFGPGDDVQRAQVAAFLVRALGWQGRPTGPRDFSDFDGLVQELQDAVRIIANACADPADAATCVARGYGDGRFGPTDPVTHAQVVAFIARAFAQDEQFAWQAQPGGAQPYAGVPAAHDAEVRTYHFYAGAIPDAPDTAAGWNSPASRAWVARVLWQALLAQP
jgi:hypothetical protein